MVIVFMLLLRLNWITSHQIRWIVRFLQLISQYDYKKLRITAASYIKDNKEDFEPFLFADDFSLAKDIDSYCKEIEETAIWGGEMEITAISRALDVQVEIYSNRSPTPLVINPKLTNKDEESVIRLAYYQHLYGLGQHYNSLYKNDT